MSALPELPRSIREVDEAAARDLDALDRVTGHELQAAQPAVDRHAFHVPDLADFMTADLSPPKYVVDTLIPAGTVTLLGAHGGAGKSVLALTLAAHVATGSTWAGFGVERGPVVFVSLEDPAALVLYRLRRIVATYSLDAGAVAASLIVLDGADGDGALGIEHAHFGARQFLPTARFDLLRERAAGARLVVVDNASDAFDGNENERRMVRAFVRMLGELARDNDAGVLLLAHVDKAAAKFGSQGNSYSGSTAWHNSARSRLAMLESDGAIELRQEKLNVGKPAEPLTLRWSEHGVLVPWTTAAASGEQDGDAAGVLAALQEATAHGVPVPAGRTGPSTAQKSLETCNALPEALRGVSGRDRFWRAMNRLMQSGCAGSEEYRNADRKVRRRIIALPAAPIPCARQSPIPPSELERRRPPSAPVCASHETGAEPAQTGARCQRCDGEGCHHCTQEIAR